MPVSPYTPNADAPHQPKLLERIRIYFRTQHYSIRTEQAYVDWARCFILFHKKWHPQKMETCGRAPPTKPNKLLRLRQQGAALLAAMLIVSLVATLAASSMWQQWRSSEIEAAERTRVQAAWILVGALDWSRLILIEDYNAGGADHLAEPWAVPLEEARLSTFLAAEKNVSQVDDATIDTADAFLSGQILDLQARLNLNNLLDGDSVQPEILAQWERLFTRLGLPRAELETLTLALRQSLNPEAKDAPLRPPTIGQWTWLGLTPSTIARLAPYATLLPQRSKINLNTASAEVLLASIEGLDQAAANRLLAARQNQHLRSLEDARALLGENAQIKETLHDVRSSYFEVHGRLRLEDVTVQERSIVYRQGREVRTLWRERGAVPAPPPTMARQTDP
ncbi:type II secretion system minor pseudopilin GspK [Giesbergeria sp.]|uniref:type II secretion system minor pseudopilin GspK n=1 Tax=Giesbergeria sp. TaxID=2818473 RepID=UPI0034345B11